MIKVTQSNIIHQLDIFLLIVFPNCRIATLIFYKGSVKPFEQLDPIYAEFVRKRIENMKLTSVYGLEGNQELQKAVREAREYFN